MFTNKHINIEPRKEFIELLHGRETWTMKKYEKDRGSGGKRAKHQGIKECLA